MTDKEINVAIAKACGWLFYPDKKCIKRFSKCEIVVNWCISPSDRTFSVDDIPNYCFDLNAMHDAESSLSYDNQTKMLRLMDRHDGWLLLHATARQRAEAFLRTIGKWVD